MSRITPNLVTFQNKLIKRFKVGPAGLSPGAGIAGVEQLRGWRYTGENNPRHTGRLFFSADLGVLPTGNL